MYYFAAHCSKCNDVTIQKSRKENAKRGKCIDKRHR